ncbi:MAG: hypothetical protein ACK5MO_24985, partial [Planctomyces sp.]
GDRPGRGARLARSRRAAGIVVIVRCGVPFWATWGAPGFWWGGRGVALPATEQPATEVQQ